MLQQFESQNSPFPNETLDVFEGNFKRINIETNIVESMFKF